MQACADDGSEETADAECCGVMSFDNLASSEVNIFAAISSKKNYRTGDEARAVVFSFIQVSQVMKTLRRNGLSCVQ